MQLGVELAREQSSFVQVQEEPLLVVLVSLVRDLGQVSSVHMRAPLRRNERTSLQYARKHQMQLGE